jgi:hypothetical protein
MSIEPVPDSTPLSPEEYEIVRAREEASRAARPPVNGHRPPPARDLPHSIEAEEVVLSSCMIDGADVIPKCHQAHLEPESFYSPPHALIFSALRDLHRAGKPTDAADVAQELQRTGKLAQAGGFPLIAQVSEKVPTIAQASTAIDLVRSYALRRDMIRGATSFVENCYAPANEIDDLVRSFTQSIAVSAERASPADSILQSLHAARYDPTRRLPDISPVFYLKSTAVCTKGNLTSITAQSKVGKSSFLSGVLASTFKDPDHGGDTFAVRSENSAGRALIHFDTEQHAKDHERMLDLVMRRAGQTTLPAWLNSYPRKGTSAERLRLELETLLKYHAKKFGGIHSVHLDGVADMVIDVNDPGETNPFVSWLEHLSVTYDCPFLLVLHLNPVTTKDSIHKSRGHLGSHLQRKCETDIRLKKETDTTTVVYTDLQGTRRAPLLEKDGVRFEWDHQYAMHLSCDRPPSPILDIQREKLIASAEGAFAHADKKALRYADLISAITAHAGITRSSAEDRLTKMRKLQILQKDMLGFYSVKKEATGSL